MKRLLAALLLGCVLAGCAAKPAPAEAPAAAPAPAAAEPPSPVYTDWSKLTPYEPTREIFSYHPGYCADGAFEPRGDYGALLPYIGRYSTMEQYVIDALPFYGLVTDKGELVTEAVYTDVWFYDEFLLLYRGGPENGGCTLAASDGRWAHELAGGFYVGNGCGLLMTAEDDRSLELWNADGEVVTRFDRARFTPYLGEEFVWGDEGGPFVNWTDDKVGYVVSYLVNDEYVEDGVRLYLDFSDGAVMTEPPAGYPAEIDYEALEDACPEPPEVEGCRYLSPITDEVTGETYFSGFCSGENGVGYDALFDGSGRLLVKNVDMWRFEASIIVRAGLCGAVEDGCFCLRSLKDGSLVFRCVMRTNTD